MSRYANECEQSRKWIATNFISPVTAKGFVCFFQRYVFEIGRDERSWITFNQIYMLNLIAKFDVKLLVSKQFNPMEKTSLKTSKDINKTSQPSGGHRLVRSFEFLYMFLINCWNV